MATLITYNVDRRRSDPKVASRFPFAQRLVFSQPITPVCQGKVGEAVSSGIDSNKSWRSPDVQKVVAPDPVQVGRRQRTFRYPLSHDPMYAKLSTGEIVHEAIFTFHHQSYRLFTPSIDGRLRPSRCRSRICRDWCYWFCCCAAYGRPTQRHPIAMVSNSNLGGLNEVREDSMLTQVPQTP
jgi:hypothetical protein